MKNPLFLKVLATLCAAPLFALLAPAAYAYTTTPVVDPASQSLEALASNTDLLTGLTPSSTEQADQVSGFNFTVGGINDGATTPGPDGAHATYFEGSAQFASTNNLNLSPVVTFTFDTSVNTRGYDVTSLQSIYGWDDVNSFDDQDYTITYTLVDSATSHTLGSVAFNPFDPQNDLSGNGPQASSLVTLSDIGLSGVSSISFEFTPYTSPVSHQEQKGQLIQEIDVFGAATVPEPRTWAMILGGFFFMVVLTRHRIRA